MNSLEQRWIRLVTVARRASVPASAEAVPHGFTTRMVALWATRGAAAERASTWASMALSGCGVAILLAIVVLVTWGPALGQSSAGGELVALTDPLPADSSLP
jgi:hypothetical protein